MHPRAHKEEYMMRNVIRDIVIPFVSVCISSQMCGCALHGEVACGDLLVSSLQEGHLEVDIDRIEIAYDLYFTSNSVTNPAVSDRLIECSITNIGNEGISITSIPSGQTSRLEAGDSSLFYSGTLARFAGEKWGHRVLSISQDSGKRLKFRIRIKADDLTDPVLLKVIARWEDAL